MKEGAENMARQPAERSPKKTYTITREAKGGTLKTQKEASERWEEKNPKDRILIRIPAGAKDIISEYVKKKAEENPTSLKYNAYNGKAYRPSMNALIIALLEEEMGQSLS